MLLISFKPSPHTNAKKQKKKKKKVICYCKVWRMQVRKSEETSFLNLGKKKQQNKTRRSFSFGFEGSFHQYQSVLKNLQKMVISRYLATENRTCETTKKEGKKSRDQLYFSTELMFSRYSQATGREQTSPKRIVQSSKHSRRAREEARSSSLR